MSRKCENWIISYLDYTEKTESPEIFHLWSAISVIAGALGRKCWIDHGFYMIYPNHYIILVAESGMMRKSTAAEIAIGLYNEVHSETQVLSKKITLQRLLINLEKTYTQTGNSFGYVFNSELSVLIGRGGTNDLLDFLTDTYGCPNRWSNETKGKGDDVLYNVYINLLSCVPPKDLATMPTIMVDGGFSGRTIFVYASSGKDRKPPIADPSAYFTKEKYALHNDLIEDLYKISAMSGVFTLTKTAAKLYKKIYDRNYYKTDFTDKMIPYQARKGDHLKSLSIILSAANRDTLEITEGDIKQADQLLTMVETSMAETFGYMIEDGTSNATKHITRFLRFLDHAGGKIDHSVVMRKMYRYTTKEELKQIVETLVDSGIITAYCSPKRWYERN